MRLSIAERSHAEAAADAILRAIFTFKGLLDGVLNVLRSHQLVSQTLQIATLPHLVHRDEVDKSDSKLDSRHRKVYPPYQIPT